MKRKVDAERLLRSFYADELAEASARTEDRHPGVRPVADRGQSPAAPREREPPARAARERAHKMPSRSQPYGRADDFLCARLFVWPLGMAKWRKRRSP